MYSGRRVIDLPTRRLSCSGGMAGKNFPGVVCVAHETSRCCRREAEHRKESTTRPLIDKHAIILQPLHSRLEFSIRRGVYERADITGITARLCYYLIFPITLRSRVGISNFSPPPPDTIRYDTVYCVSINIHRK